MTTPQATPPAPRPATSRDVARAAGVSQATVSLVLGDKWHGRVSPAKAETVRAAARRLGYRPNLAARSLRTGRTGTALLVVPALTTEFFARVYTGAARVATDHGFGVVLYPSPATGPAHPSPAATHSGRPVRAPLVPDPFASAAATLDGVIASSMAAEALTALRSADLPLVMLDSDPDDDRATATVNLDIAAGVRQLTGHLTALGHRRITHLAADVPSWTFGVRAHAVTTALAELPGALLHRLPTALDVDAGMRAAHTALTGPGPRPTALLCDDDIIAAGACKAVRRLGLRVPDDISVTGFDDLALARAVEPELTTVRLPAEEFGAAGLRALIAALDGRPTQPPGPLPVELITRGSTAPPPPIP
ncbi:putative LacI family transcriptional regulator [Streptomyces sp. NBRC 110611]|uniref:LacI family DNA-binding transcriptional regulator n=1 Tax=Streptomyces sp. NBRC 110611 TaxID=1621259 RepID=UPI00082EEEFD|nr:LacI family DNA-binding transcriptional regulator [Streptomyces sp. NBRC 110611]GAU66217.1 putative LacI family transcriptional regulator [Streptomyces sp. NBRC 110611]